MWGKIVTWVAKKFWPFIQAEVLPLIWKSVIQHADEIFTWLAGIIKERFEKNASESKEHAKEQELQARTRAVQSPDESLANAWREAADYWRDQYERADALLHLNVVRTEQDFDVARNTFRDAIDNTPVQLDFSSDAIRATIGSVECTLEAPKE